MVRGVGAAFGNPLRIWDGNQNQLSYQFCAHRLGSGLFWDIEPTTNERGASGICFENFQALVSVWLVSELARLVGVSNVAWNCGRKACNK